MKKIFITLLFSYNLFAYTNYCSSDYNPDTDVLVYNTQYSSNCAFGLTVDTIYCDSVNGRVKVVDSTTEITVAGTCTDSYELYPEKQFKTNVYNILKNSSCPAGQIKNLDGICEDPPPCVSEPMPDKTPLKFGLTFSSCNDYVSIGSLDINSSSYNNLSCFTDTCSDMTEYTLFGDLISCQPLSDTTVNISQSDCSGLLNNWDGGYSGLLSWNTCDNSCYVLELQGIPCSNYTEPILDNLFSNCDSDLNDYKFACVDGGLSNPSTISTSCVPKNQNYVSPCDDFYNNLLQTCLSPQVIEGSCYDDGIRVLPTTTMKCVDSVPSCDGWHEVLNTLTNQCECESGYKISAFGDCSKDLFPDIPDSNLTQSQLDLQSQEDTSSHDNSIDYNQSLQTNNSLGNLEGLATNLNDTVGGIRDDLSTTNNLLNDIKDILNNDNNTSSSVSWGFDDLTKSRQSEIDNSLTNMYDVVNGMKTDYDNLINTLSKGFDSSPASLGTDPKFTSSNVPFTIDLCPVFSVFYPVFYYIFTILMLLASIRIYIKAFRS